MEKQNFKSRNYDFVLTNLLKNEAALSHQKLDGVDLLKIAATPKIIV